MVLTLKTPRKRFTPLLFEDEEYYFGKHRAMIDQSWCMEEEQTTKATQAAAETDTDAGGAGGAGGAGDAAAGVANSDTEGETTPAVIDDHKRRFFVEGLIHVGSKGIAFEPLNSMMNILRLRYADMTSFQAWQPSAEQICFFDAQLFGADEEEAAAAAMAKRNAAAARGGGWGSWLTGKVRRSTPPAQTKYERGFEFLRCSAPTVTEMNAKGKHRPYVTRTVTQPFCFTIQQIPHKPAHTIQTRINRLLILNHLMSDNETNAREEIAAMIREHESEVIEQSNISFGKFPPTGERLIVDGKCVKVKPLMTVPGRLAVTTKAVYFWPFHKGGAVPPQVFQTSTLFRAARRRFMLRRTAIELTARDALTATLFNWESVAHCELSWHFLSKVQGLSIFDNAEWQTIVRQWQQGKISNFHYLMYLNSMADRSFNDITQYPVFPWVIADYSSPTLDLTKPSTFRNLRKPIGALNAERLAMYKERFEGMGDEDHKFLYGTHYSTPAYTLFYLLRSHPQYMLRLQSGRYDQADRLFHSIAATWRTCSSNPSDVKELIPEFYQPPGEFLKNSQALDLGQRQDGTTVGDVELPPWASDAKDFTTKCREALESDYVSDHLHSWIDLIFGLKQRGEAAKDADNLFHPYTYEGAVDMNAPSEERERRAIMAQICEFGQTPKQLFIQPHPRRRPRAGTAAATSAASPASTGTPPRGVGGNGREDRL